MLTVAWSFPGFPPRVLPMRQSGVGVCIMGGTFTRITHLQVWILIYRYKCAVVLLVCISFLPRASVKMQCFRCWSKTPFNEVWSNTMGIQKVWWYWQHSLLCLDYCFYAVDACVFAKREMSSSIFTDVLKWDFLGFYWATDLGKHLFNY